MSKLTKVEDWEARLGRFIASKIHARFEWGKNDCCYFARDAVKQITGCRFTLPTYHDRGGALKALKANGTTVSELVDLHLGPNQNVEPFNGDIVMIDPEHVPPTHRVMGDDGPLGVMYRGMILCPARVCLGTFQPSDVKKVWTISNPS
jgi:hypothetical protein